MYLYKIIRKSPCGWDEYDSAVVIAENEEDAKMFTVFEHLTKSKEYNPDLNVFYLGEFHGDIKDYPGRVILGSYNAG